MPSSPHNGGLQQRIFDALTLAGQRADALENTANAWALFSACYALGGGSASRVSATNMLLKQGRAAEAQAEYEAMVCP